MKRLSAFLCSIMLLLASMLTAMPLATAAGTNLVANPSAEDSISGKPTAWSSSSWGTNSTAFTYNATGNTGTHSLTTKMTSRSSGDAKWYFNAVSVAPNTSYTFSDWYQSNVVTNVDLVITNTAGQDSYIWLGNPAASTVWKQNSYTFTTPANAAKVTVFHSLSKVGQLTVDDYSLVNNSANPGPTAPTVAMTAPAAGSTVSGTATLSANASDAVAVSSVQFKVDGVNVGTPATTAPYSFNWDSKSVANGSHTLTAVATNSSNLSTTSSPVSINVSNTASPTAPTVSVTAPAASATVSGTATLSANASDAVAVSSVQFKIDGVNVGTPAATAPYSVSWDSKSVANGTHTVTAVATNSSNLTTTSSPVSITVSNTVTPTPPTVSITAPAAASTVSGTATLSANASDAVSVKSVQFKVDGNNIGAADTTAPYSVSWDSKTVSNGAHSVTAVATNSTDMTTTSAAVSINVSNTATPPTTNLIANPSVEDGGTTPASWTANSWGTNTASNTYEATGHTGTKSLKTTVSSYSNGDAKWMHASVPVTATTSYNYSNWYKSSADSELDAMVTMSDGTVQYFWLASVPASADWKQVSVQFTAPTGARNLTIFQVLARTGYVQTDDYSLTTYVPTPLSRPLVSLNFDDGWRSIYSNGLPILKKYNMVSTQYLNSEPVVEGYPDYMTYAMIKEFASLGHELGWHTRTHADLTTLSVSGIDTELNIPAAFLNGTGTTAATYRNFATPFGAYNTTAVNEIKKFYRSHRSTDVGYNSKDSLNVYNIKVQNITNTTTPATVQAWVNQAKATNTWLVIVYHEVDTNAEDPTYAVTPANLDAELNIIKQSGLTVLTMDQALNELAQQ